MCNAHNHSAGCQCGFGPRPSETLRHSHSSNWPSTVIDEPWLLKRGLSDLNWDKTAVAWFVDQYTRLTSENLPRETLVAKIKELLGHRRMEVEKEWTETLDVPLFRFGAPRAKGAVVTYIESIKTIQDRGWALRVFGVGTGSTHEFEVTTLRDFAAASGECKEVFVPIPMRVERIAVFDGHRLVGRGVRAEAEVPGATVEVVLNKRTCKALHSGECCAKDGDAAEDHIECALAGMKPDEVHHQEKRWMVGDALGFSLTLRKVVEVGPFIRLRRVRELCLRFALPGGVDYLGHISLGRLWWEKPE